MNHENELEMLRKVTNDPDLEIIGLDDTFDFQCQQCGRCCINRGDIIINPFDVYKAAKHLGITCSDFLSEYTTLTYGHNSRIPMVLLASDKKTGFCPLLKFDVKDGGKFKCLVHEAKPGACWNHPIGLVTNTPADNGIAKLGEEPTMTYVKVSQCENSKGHNSPQLVRDWVKPSLDFAKEVQYAHMLQSYIEKFVPAKLFDIALNVMSMPLPESAPEALKEAQKGIENIREEFFYLYIGAVYAEYETDKPFIPQAEENMKKLDNLLEEPAKLIKTLFCALPDHLKEQLNQVLHDERCRAWIEQAEQEGISND